MNRVEIIEVLVNKHGVTKAEGGRILATLLETFMTAVKKGDTVSLPGFGSFKQVARAARSGRNPATGDKIKIAAQKLPKFTAGSEFKALVDPKAAARKAEKAGKPAPSKKAAAKKAPTKKSKG